MPLKLDRKQEAWPTLAAAPAPEPGRDHKRDAAADFPPIAAVFAKFADAPPGTPLTAPPPSPAGFSTESFAGQHRLIVPVEKLIPVLAFLKTDPALQFDYLMDVIGIDYLHFRKARHRFGVVYSLLSHSHNHRLWVKVFVDEPNPTLPTVYDLWNAADWLEREVFDMFGIIFEGHPDLRRILLPPEFVSHPLRKDYPLTGQGERHDFVTVDLTTV